MENYGNEPGSLQALIIIHFPEGGSPWLGSRAVSRCGSMCPKNNQIPREKKGLDKIGRCGKIGGTRGRILRKERNELSMKNKEAAIAAVRTCRTREEIDDMLSRFDIADGHKAVGCLNEAMYRSEIFFTSKPADIKDELEFTKQIFLTGTWRLNEYYERMGIAV